MTNDLLSDEHIQKAAFSSALSERYLAYALSTITARSLPDVRDGLKPVHRRLLFAMRRAEATRIRDLRNLPVWLAM